MWKTKDGKKIRIKDMTDSHLLNTMKFLQRNALNTLFKLDSCSNFDEDSMAFAIHEDAIEDLIEMDENERTEEFYPIYCDMYKEALKRKLIK